MPSGRFAYYNEFDPFAADWLRNLIAAGHIADGVVDTRSIVDVQADDLRGFAQVHLFAGIGGWSHAARLAGWPDDRPLWTGSCPCQPFSAAGKGGGFDDDRHLWPHFFRLIGERRPPVVFGEQVASPLGLGWLDTVQDDMEGAGYAFAALDLCSAGVGAPHIRQRIGFVADADHQTESRRGIFGPGESNSEGVGAARKRLTGFCSPRELGKSNCGGSSEGHEAAETDRHWGAAVSASRGDRPGPTNGFWRDPDWLLCRDGKWRPVESGTFPLAHGISGRVGRLRAYGNAINPHQFAAFIGAYLDAAA